MNAKEFEEHKKNCKMCNRKGLPILLTRYAIAQKRSAAPPIGGSFKVAVDPAGTPAPPLDADSLYTQRLLRAGYLYIYDEENINDVGRKAPWKGYVINREGYLTPFPVPVPPPPYVLPSPVDADKPCDPWANEALARCITILHPEKARTIWIGFSDTRWTDAVLKAHEDPETRNRHMRSFDVGQWWNAVAHEHACGLDQCATNIAELGEKISAKDFAFSPAGFIVPRYARDTETLQKLAGVQVQEYPISKKAEDKLLDSAGGKLSKLQGEEQKALATALVNCNRSTVQLLAHAAERLLGAENKHKAAILALDDPAGLLMDLSVYMDYALKQYMDEVIPVKFYREITISSIIGVLKKGVIEAKKSEIIRESKRKPIEMNSPNSYDAGPGNAAMLIAKPEQFEKVCNSAWDQYANKIDEDKVKAWPERVKESIESFDKEHIVPLANAYVAWFDSPLFTGNMECNHDPAHFDSGLAYTELVSLCLGGAQDKTAVGDYLMQKLSEDRFAHINVVMRAFLANQDKYIEVAEGMVGKIVLSGATVDQVKIWSDVVDKMAAAIGATSATEQKALDWMFSRLTLKTGSVLMRLVQEVSHTKKVSSLLAAIGAINELGFMQVHVKGTEAQVQNRLAQKFAEFTDKPYDSARFSTALQSRLQEMNLNTTAGTTEYDDVILINVKRMEAGLLKARSQIGTKAEETRINAFMEAASVSPDDISFAERMALVQSLNMEAAAAEQYDQMLQRYVQRNLPFTAAILGGIVQITSLISASQAVDKARRTGEKVKEEESKYYGAISGTIAAIAGVAEQFGARSANLLRFAPALFDKEKFFIKYASKCFGLFGGAVSLYWNVVGMRKSWDNDQYGIMSLYIAAAGADFMGLVLLLWAFRSTAGTYAVLMTGIGLAVFVVGLIVMFGLMLFADNALQEWLGKCIFGKDKADRYLSVEEELRALRNLGV